MDVNHRAWALPSEMPAVASGPAGPVFMFGRFGPADSMSSELLRTLDEAILGIREDADPAEVTTWTHHHAEVAADASSSAFMFGVQAEQPSSTTLVELPLYLRAAGTGLTGGNRPPLCADRLPDRSGACGGGVNETESRLWDQCRVAVAHGGHPVGRLPGGA